jgi:hypothetical protein
MLFAAHWLRRRLSARRFRFLYEIRRRLLLAPTYLWRSLMMRTKVIAITGGTDMQAGPIRQIGS